MDIDAIIDAAVTTAPEQVAPQAAPVENAPEAPQTQDAPEDKSLEFKPDSELTPEQLAKRESNRISHLKSRSAKQVRELRELREFKAQQLQSLQQQPPSKPVDNGSPKLENFETLDEWVLATANHLNTKTETPKPVVAPDPYLVKRNMEIEQDTAEFEQRFPEYKNLVQANIEFFQNMPPRLSESLQSALLKIQSPALALNTMMKDGSLYDLEDMNPVEIGIALASAYEKGKAMMGSVNRVTNAPAPLAPARGNTSGVKSTRSMSFEELQKDLGLI